MVYFARYRGHKVCPGLWEIQRWLPERAAIGGKGKTTEPAQGESGEVRDVAGVAHQEEIGRGETMRPTSEIQFELHFEASAAFSSRKEKKRRKGEGLLKEFLAVVREI
jgi:hypothetical protein